MAVIIALLAAGAGCTGADEGRAPPRAGTDAADSAYADTLLADTSYAGRVYTVEEVDESPTPVRLLQIVQRRVEYPQAARDQKIGGTMVVQFVVSPEGRPTNIRVVKAAHPLLNRDVLRAVRQVTLPPARVDGRPVPLRVTLPVNFSTQ
jgi:TonB family protein